MSAPAFQKNLGRAHALRRAAKSVLLNQVAMKLIARRDLSVEPQLAIYSHDLIGQAINIYGWWEHEQLMLLRAFVLSRCGRGGAMLDVGANIGNHAIYLQDLFDEIHAIEASPRTHRLLQFNVERFAHITAHNFAASDAEGWLDFVVEGHNAGASHVAGAGPAAAVAPQHIQVRARKLDDALKPAGPVRLIKIDVEGHELPCLHGLGDIIRKDFPFIVFEQHEADFSGGSSPVIEALRALGYARFFAVSRVPAGGRRGLAGQVWSVLQAAVLGFRIEAVETQHFEPGFYEMIIATR